VSDIVRRNLVKQRLRNGETVIGTMVQETRTASIGQIFKMAGFDFFMIDMEHGSYTLESAADILRVGRLVDMSPLVRVAAPAYQLIAGVLDQGAMGIMLPRVESRADVEALVEAMKYPPVGKRGCSSDAPHSEYDFPPLGEWLATHNEDTLAIAQIERRIAVDRIDDILSVAGVDVALIGPEDLSVSLGVPGETGHPIVVEAIEHVLAAAERHGVVTGIHMGSVERLRGWMARGMRMIMYNSDLSFLLEGGAAGVAQLRDPAS
jgi:2-dehydro-3-deoxyglucarate aldolase/4-hydroxy-2-oxoheptanedioate aldolase